MLIDQEGGDVRRLPGAPMLSEREIGQARNPVELAQSAGTSTGRNLARIGVNVNLAPVLDVYRASGDFIDQFQRSYSTDPSLVGRLGAAFIRAQQAAGVAATAKHFPGLGIAPRGENTDLTPVTLNASLGTLRSVDEAPYGTAIAAGVKLVMTSWAIYPAFDPRQPAGLSATIIRGELRGRLRFRGVTITDGIDADAVTAFGGLATRSVRAAAAGADLILCAATNPSQNTPRDGLVVFRAIASAIAGHRLGYDGALQAAQRIARLRADP
jgi:beta-N-acetylhexosaminidase